MKLILNKWFDIFILFMILCSTARLIFDIFNSGYAFFLAYNILHFIFIILFFLEFLTKIFAIGFVLNKGNYLRGNLNKIDITIVI